jgi:hypothetical protein
MCVFVHIADGFVKYILALMEWITRRLHLIAGVAPLRKILILLEALLYS